MDQPKRLYPVIGSLIEQGISVQQACISLGVSESGYYAWKNRLDSPTTLRRIWLAGEIADIHKEPGGYLWRFARDSRAPLRLRHRRQSQRRR